MAFNQNQIEVVFERPSKTYRYGDAVRGVVKISTRMDIKHEGVALVFSGTCNLQMSQKSAGLVESLYKPVKTIALTWYSTDLAPPGIFVPGKYQLPFEFTLTPAPGKTLYDTYHGVNVSVQYNVKITVKRTFPNKFIDKTVEFVVEMTEHDARLEAGRNNMSLASVKPATFQRSHENTVSHARQRVPKFQLTGKIDTTSCLIGEPFTGDIEIQSCSALIRSIELQLIRKETCGASDTGFSCERSEVQNMQVADGDVCRGLPVPLHMVFPRLFACPSLCTPHFRLEFEVNVVVVFDTDYMVSELVPITLHRF